MPRLLSKLLSPSTHSNLLRLIRHPALVGLNKGANILDFRRFFACGYVSYAVMKFLYSGDDKYLKVKYKYEPLDTDKALEMCTESFGSTARLIPRTSLAALPNLLRYSGVGTLAMVGADYDPRKTKKELGIIPRVWSHWFVVAFVNGIMYPVDAWSSEELDKCLNSRAYLEQYKQDSDVCAIIVPPENKN